jgi:membrane protease YdiL (CAAX protease family)
MRSFFAFPLVRLVLIVLLFGALSTPVVLATHGQQSGWASVALSWVLLAALLLSTVIIERVTVRKSLAAIGFGKRKAVRDFALGAALGAGLFSIVVLELTIGGHYRIVAAHFTPDLAMAALLLLPGAAIEELLFRGLLFRLIEEWSGTWIALVASAALFGLVHAANPGATWVSTLAIALEAGVLLAAAYVVARNLWFPIGLHFAWNFAEGPIYGAQVSGHTFGTSAVAAQFGGPTLLTGGAFGPEAGLGAMLTCLVAAIALLTVAVRRSQVIPADWKMSRMLKQ